MWSGNFEYEALGRQVPHPSVRFARLAGQAREAGAADYAERLIDLAYHAAGVEFADEPAAAQPEPIFFEPILRRRISGALALSAV